MGPDRRAVLSVVQAETSTAPGVTAIGLDTATGAASMASAVNSVKKSNSHYSGVASVSASNFQSVGQAYTYTGTFAVDHLHHRLLRKILTLNWMNTSSLLVLWELRCS